MKKVLKVPKIGENFQKRKRFKNVYKSKFRPLNLKVQSQKF